MRIDPFRIVEAVRASYWFVPSLMSLAAILLGVGAVWLDSGPGADWLSGIGWYQSAKPDGAHEVLSTIAGSMITVAGVVFSITIVAISFAAGQYGPRLLTNFMGDRGNQVTLGTFLATFLYCLVVLRTIRGGDDEFVPQIGVMVGMVLALCSIGVLIYFIHHVPRSIHLNHVVADIGRQLLRGVEDRFPAFIGDPPDPEEKVEEPSREAVAALGGARPDGAAAVQCRHTGYIQALDDEALLEAARRCDLVVRLRYRPGDFVHRGRPLADAWPAERLSEEAADAIRASFTVGSRRTPLGDLQFLVDELAEIAGRALSTGVNDPTTACTCLDWLGSGASEIARRRLPSPRRTDGEGTVRVLALPEDFETFLARAFGQVRQYVAGDKNAALHALRTLGEVAAACRTKAQIDAIAREAGDLARMAKRLLDGPALEAVCAREAALQRLLEAGPGGVDERQADWLGGSAAAGS